jgi:hypothetical protein
MRTFSLALLTTALLAGCLGASDEPSPGNNAGDDADCTVDATGCAPPRAHVVVADIDSGINVYHERFAGTIPDDLLATFTNDGKPPVRIQLNNTGDFQARLAADQAMWDSLEPATLYYFEGTRILGISFTPSTQNIILDFPDGSHGTATAGAVFDANPEAILVMVEGGGVGADETWAAAQPWIDVVTMSYGPPGSVPGSASAFGLTTHTATKQMWAEGKVPVGAADNSPSLAPNDETAGPPWVIGVGGDDPDLGCREHVSGTFPDFTADFTQVLPNADSVDERHETSGTSFSTPATAGTTSAALLAIRQAWNHTDGITDGALAIAPDGTRLTNVGLREALNLTAYYFTGENQCPGPDPQPVNPAAPWAQMGWGHVGPEIVNSTVNHVLGILVAADKPEARAFQEGVMEYRRALWSVIP